MQPQLSLVTALVSVCALLVGVSLAPAGARTGITPPAPMPAGLSFGESTFPQPPTTAQCLTRQHQACYSPHQLEAAYDMTPLFAKGLNGHGITIAIVDSFGSPTITRDLAHFDHDFGLAPPPSFRIITPSGKVSPYNKSGSDRVGWAMETSLDVEYAHAMAPGAKILLVETPIDETIGVVGFPQMIHAENFLIHAHLAQVISQSFGAAEQTFPNSASIRRLRSAFFNARAHHVTVVASTGDQGPTSVSNPQGTRYFTRRVSIWPATDPLVTAVGGTALHLNKTGRRTVADTAWNDCPNGGCVSAGGGGTSTVFARPAFQDSVKTMAGPWRLVPDISMSGDPRGGALVYTSFPGPNVGYHVVGGTSESSPLFSGIVAVADQANGSPLGYLNKRLYRLGSGSPGITDIVKGETTVTFRQDGKKVTVSGYSAIPGFDLATGLGTIDGAKLVKALTGK